MSTSCKVLSEMSEQLIAGFVGKPVMYNGVHTLIITPRVQGVGFVELLTFTLELGVPICSPLSV